MATKIALQDWNQLSTSSAPVIGDYSYDVQSAHQPWSVQVLDANSVRFEIHDNDRHSWDIAAGAHSERDELSANQNPIANGTPLHISYGFMVEPGAPNTAAWAVFGQLHQDLATVGPATSPPFEIKLVGEKLEIDIGYGSTANPQRKVLFLDSADIDRGHLYDMQITAVFDPAGNGRLVVVKDGVTLVDYSGPLGYTEQHGVYWAEGIYRSDNATETMAVQYRNLQIATGSNVTFQGKDVFIDAPVIQVGAVAHAAGSSDATLSLTGCAKVGTVVSIFEDGQLVAKAAVDASGQYQANVVVSGAGQHSVTAKATDASGHDGILSAPTAVLVGTSADIVAKLGTLSSIPNLGAIVLTGDTVLHVSSMQQLSYAQRADLGALAKITGGYSIIYSQTSTNSGYDRVETAYASNGQMIEYMRYLGAKIVLDDVYAADGSHVVRTRSADGSSDVNTINSTGRTTNYERDDANGKVVLKQEFRADGTTTTHRFSTVTGLETSTTVTGADKSHVDTNYVQGQSYATEVYTYDAANHMTKQERFTTAGTKIFSQIWNTDGSKVVHYYAASTGVETGSSLINANGSHVDTTLGITDKAYATEVYTYDAANRVTMDERFAANGTKVYSQVVNADGSKTVHNFAAATGTETSSTVIKTDGSHIDTNYVQGQAYATQVDTYDTANRVIKEERFTQTGTKVYSQVSNADGSKTVHNFAAATGTELSSTVIKMDGSHVDTNYVQGQSYAMQVYTYDAANHMTKEERFTQTGVKILSQVFNPDGSKTVHNYAATTGAETSSSVIKADGSHLDTTLGISGKAYTSLATSFDSTGRAIEQDTYNAAGKLTSSELYLVDGSKKAYTVATSGALTGYVLTATDGTKQIVTFDSAGKVASTDVFAKDGSHTLSVFAGSIVTKTDAYDAAGHLATETVFNAKGAMMSVMSVAANGTQNLQTLDATTGQVVSTKATATDGSSIVNTFGIKGQAYTSTATSYNASGKAIESLRWSGDKLVYDQVNSSDGKTMLLKTWSAAGELTAIHYNPDGSLASTDRYAANGIHVSADIRHADGSHELHNYNASTGVETDYTIYHSDQSRETVNLAVVGQPYATQHATYDKAGKLTDMVRHYGSDTGQIALAQHVHQDGSSEVYSYDVSGREVGRVVTQADQSHDNVSSTYSGTSATPVTVQQDHYATATQKAWTDVTTANGSHTVTAYTSGQTLESHLGVADLFNSAGGDTFVFKPGFGQDTIKSFHAGEAAGHDVIQIDHTLAADLAHLSVHDVGQNAVITLGAHDTITLTNVHAAQLTAHDFLFV